MQNPVFLEQKSRDLSDNVPERWRPRLHFTPQKNWMNDPNGLVYFDGEYHLFFQYNPFGKSWGHMSWGHAVSDDLVTWRELPVAMPEQDYMIFSGCIVIDWKNDSGFGDGVTPPMVAFYTAFYEAENKQAQHVAFSNDRGRTWHQFDANPIIDLNKEHFRDPCVFWHEESGKWCMLLAHAADHRIEFYHSDNLRDWVAVGDFGPIGNCNGLWECPTLFQASIQGQPGKTSWVLKVDVDKHLVGAGSGAQYFVGHFDGTRFEPQRRGGEVVADIADHGGEFYAAITWSDLPDGRDYPVWIGWMSNHQSGHHAPTEPWRGAQTLARELFLFEEGGLLKLGQRPVPELNDRRTNRASLSSVKLSEGSEQAIAQPSQTNTWELCFSLAHVGNTDAGVKLVDEAGGVVFVGFDANLGSILIDRLKSGANFHEEFPACHSANYQAAGSIEFRLIVDESSIELFIDGGRRVLTSAIYPEGKIAPYFYCYEGECAFSEIALFSYE